MLSALPWRSERNSERMKRRHFAGVGTSLPLGPSTGNSERRGEGPALEKDELTTYRKLARCQDPFGLLQARSSRSRFLRSEGQ